MLARHRDARALVHLRAFELAVLIRQLHGARVLVAVGFVPELVSGAGGEAARKGNQKNAGHSSHLLELMRTVSSFDTGDACAFWLVAARHVIYALHAKRAQSPVE